MAGPRHVWVLVPAAGESRRFREAGFETPKPRLRVAHSDLFGASPRLMLHHVLSAVPDDWPRLAALPTVAEPADLAGRGGERLHVCAVPRTRGQADTLRQMIRTLPRRYLDATSVLILNSDVVFRRTSDLEKLVELVFEREFVVSAAVAESDDPALSYAHPYPCPQRFVEKVVTGRHAMVGAWAVRSAAALLPALDWACCQGRQEPYLSHALNRVYGPKISHLVAPDAYLDWGTPAALRKSGAVVR